MTGPSARQYMAIQHKDDFLFSKTRVQLPCRLEISCPLVRVFAHVLVATALPLS